MRRQRIFPSIGLMTLVSVSLVAAVPPAAALHYLWSDQVIDPARWNQAETSVAVSPDGTIHVAYGEDYLCYANSTATDWKVQIINENQRVVLFSKTYYIVQWSCVAIHGEHAICDDNFQSFVRMQLEFLFKMLHVRMFECVVHSLAKAHSIDD